MQYTAVSALPLVVTIPGSVLNATTACLFALIAHTGFGIVRDHAHQRGLRVLSIAVVGAYALVFVPSSLASVGVAVPGYAAILMGFPVATGALIAVVADKFVPTRLTA